MRRVLCLAVMAFMVAGCSAAAATDSSMSALPELLTVASAPATASPEPTEASTPSPTPVPTAVPTAIPTAVTTAVPTAVPTALPTAVPVIVHAAPPTPAPTVAPPPAAPTCSSSYVGVCLTPGIGDYDCAGGSGNGPNYIKGPFQVVPPDEFGLDADGDGIGCE
jgi:hypothetical protein